MKTVLIFGGSGFVGKHIIRRIAKNGYKIIIPYQKQANEAKLRLFGSTGQITPINFTSIQQAKIINLINKADVIINLKTLWDEKKTTFQKGILNFNIDLVKTIKKNKKNRQFIYFSGIGVDKKEDSERSKVINQCEQYIQKNLNNSVIIRPGVIIGGGDNFLKRLVPLFKTLYFIPIFGNGLSKFQPVYIDDISMAINIIVKFSPSYVHTQIFEFVGPNIFTYKEFYKYLFSCLNKTRMLVPIPFVVMKLVISILEKTPISPLNSEQLKLFEKDNIASNNFKNFGNLGINPQDLKEIIKNILKKNIIFPRI